MQDHDDKSLELLKRASLGLGVDHQRDSALIVLVVFELVG